MSNPALGGARSEGKGKGGPSVHKAYSLAPSAPPILGDDQFKVALDAATIRSHDAVNVLSHVRGKENPVLNQVSTETHQILEGLRVGDTNEKPGRSRMPGPAFGTRPFEATQFYGRLMQTAEVEMAELRAGIERRQAVESVSSSRDELQVEVEEVREQLRGIAV